MSHITCSSAGRAPRRWMVVAGCCLIALAGALVEAVFGSIDVTPAATLLFPEILVDLDSCGTGLNTLVTVFNTMELFPFHPCCRTITTRKKLQKDRPAYVRFLKAVIRAHEFFIKQPIPAMKIVQRYTGYTWEEVQSTLTSSWFKLNPDPLKNGYVKFWKMMNETGYITSDRDITKFIDTSVYEDALKALMKEEPANPYFKYMMKQFREQNT